MVKTNKICYIWAGKSSSHKQGKLPVGVLLNVIGGPASGRLELDPDHTKAVIAHHDPDRQSDYDQYPNFWVNVVDVSNVAGPNPDPDPIPYPIPGDLPHDLEAGQAFVVVMKWLRELWR